MLPKGDSKTLFAGGIAAFIALILAFLIVKPTMIMLWMTFVPFGLIQTVVVSLITVVVSALIAVIFNKSTLDSARTTIFYILNSPLEEITLRYTLVLIVHSLDLSLPWIIGISIVQAIIFIMLHKRKDISFIFLALLWFYVALFFGMIPAMLGHIAANIAVRIRVRKELGFYD